MRASLLLSIFLHALVLAAALVSFSAHVPPNMAQPVAVDILSPSQFAQVKAGKPDVAREKAAERAPPAAQPANVIPTAAELKPAETVSQKQAALPPSKPKATPPSENESRVEKPSPPKPDVAAQAAPKPAAAPAALKRAEAPKPRSDKPKQEQRARAESQPEKRPEPTPQSRNEADRIADLIGKPTPSTQGRSEFDPKQIAALLNRDPTAGQRPQQDGPREPWRKPASLQEQAIGAAPEEREREAAGEPSGRDSRIGASDIDAFRVQISRCWTPPVGGLGGDAIIVKLRIMLNQDGTLNRPPEVANSHNSPFFRPAADSAMRAVFQCQPYRMPPDKYGQWRDMLLNFDPSRMYGG